MTLNEIRQKVVDSEDPDWFNNVELVLNFSHINFSLKLKGVVAIYEFVSKQATGWSKLITLPEELNTSLRVFEDNKNKLIQLINGQYRRFKTGDWEDIKSELENTSRKYFTAECPEVAFLIKVATDFPLSFDSAYRFIVNNIQNGLNDKNAIIGSLLAYEFSLKDNSRILERRNAEKASIGTIRNNFLNYLNESESQMAEYIKRTNVAFDEYSESIDEIKSKKEKLFDEWFNLSQNTFIQFDQESNKRVKDLEKAYVALLSLKKPAEYWNKRATILKKEGKSFLWWLVGLVLFGCITLYVLLWLTPDGMLLSFIKEPIKAIKWSIVYVTFISLLAYGIKSVSKVMFSSFHLARDAEEREQLTYVYLAMIKDAAIDDKDRSLIMQSLFSRSDTGLLRDDSGPTMPGINAEKLSS